MRNKPITFSGIIKRGFVHYVFKNIGLVAAVMICTAILTSVFIVGDSVRYSLKQITLTRLGKTEYAFVAEKNFFSINIGSRIRDELKIPVTSGIYLPGMITKPGTSQRVNTIQVFGFDTYFWDFGENKPEFRDIGDDEIVLNTRLAERLDVKKGDEVIIRVKKINPVSYTLPVSSFSDNRRILRLTVKGIVTKKQMGRFSLKNNQAEPVTAFVSYNHLNLALLSFYINQI